MPFAPGFPPPSFETISDVETDGVNVQHVSLPTHVGTHVDAPLHFEPDGKSIDQFPIDRFAGDAVVLDVSTDTVEEIPLARLLDAEGVVWEGDIVVLYTGWCERYGDDDYDPHPWLAAEVAPWLIDRDVRMLCVDCPSPDESPRSRPATYDSFPLHRTLLENDVPITEHLGNLAGVTGERIELVGFPLRWEGADGAPARFAAKRPRSRGRAGDVRSGER